MKNQITFLISLIVLGFCGLQAQVTQEWVARYNGLGNSRDNASSIAVDGSGNVYVSGQSGPDYATIKYNSSGVQQWVQRYYGPGIYGYIVPSLVVGDSGNVYVAGYSRGSGNIWDYATIKYNSSGVQQWVQRYRGTYAIPDWKGEVLLSLAVDHLGNVYVTGTSAGSGSGNDDYATIKYNSSGDSLWVARYSGPGNYWDAARSIAVDSSGNVYVTGISSRSGFSSDYATIKYNSYGVQQWVQRYNGPVNSYDFAYSLAVDGSGNVYVTGGSGGDYATIKYNSSGDSLWVARYNGPENDWDEARSLRIDNSGNVYVTGSSYGGYATIKYNSLGDLLWVTRYGSGWDGARSLRIDNSGNVYVTGSGYATIKYDSSGDSLWVARYNGSSWDESRSLAVDLSGNVYVTGHSYVSGDNVDYATIKYSQSAGTLTLTINFQACTTTDTITVELRSATSPSI